MHANRILPYLLILTSLVVDLVLLASVSQHSTWPGILVAVLLGLAAGQINLATFWGVLGHRRLPWRIALLFVAPVGWSFAIVVSAPRILPDYNTPAMWGVHFLAQTSLLASLLFLIRLFGARFSWTDLTTSDRPLRRQFTLAYLFSWLTATAITLSALKTTFDNGQIAETDIGWGGLLTLGALSVLLGLICLWLIGDTRHYSRRLGAAFVTALPAGCILGIVAVSVNGNRLFAALLLWLVAGAYSAIALAVLRVAGFRLVWLNTRTKGDVDP